MRIRKLSMALEQLEDTLLAYFSGRYYSTIVLAGAAEELLAAHIYALAKRVPPLPAAFSEERPTSAHHSDREAMIKIAAVTGKRYVGKPVDGKTVTDSLNYA